MHFGGSPHLHWQHGGEPGLKGCAFISKEALGRPQVNIIFPLLLVHLQTLSWQPLVIVLATCFLLLNKGDVEEGHRPTLPLLVDH